VAEKRSSDGPNRGEKEIASRRDAALLRALSTPHKRQKEMKVGKRAPKVRAKGKDGG
jgi:hypothetical protein